MVAPTSRRRFERMPFFANVTIRSQSGGPSVKGRSIDISLGGVGLVSESPFPVGKLVDLTFHLSTPKGIVNEQVSGRVACVRFDDNAAIVGLEFSTILAREATPELTRMVEKL